MSGSRRMGTYDFAMHLSKTSCAIGPDIGFMEMLVGLQAKMLLHPSACLLDHCSSPTSIRNGRPVFKTALTRRPLKTVTGPAGLSMVTVAAAG